MATLPSDIRSLLERQIIRARDLSESGAERAMNRLSVNDNEPKTALSPQERKFRVRLRKRMDQLDGFADMVTECAYEKWHRMLFARFLAENRLLIHPEHQVAVTLDECKELAEEEGLKSGWELAARFANRMLPQIFRNDDPVLEVEFLPEDSQELEKLLGEVKDEVFTADDGLGWVYQFWQSKKKIEINASEVKIGAKELPAVTQLFTEPYMVSFLLDNSLGAWWAARKLTEDDLNNSETENELRRKASIPGVPLEYLRFVKEENGTWRPTAGTFDAWPENLSEFKVLDPCCGSGHFLVAALQMLVPIRMDLEGLNAYEAVDAVLSENLHGLDIDKRVTEITAFALAFTAWRFPGAGGFRQLPMLNIACSGLLVKASKETWQKFANGDHNMRIALGTLHEEFKNAPTLGSLLDPAKSPAANIVKWEDLISVLTKALDMDRTDLDLEAGVIAQELTKAAEIVSNKYAWIITNVPYLSRVKQNEILREYCDEHHSLSKNDLATVFLDRCLELCASGGVSSIVLPQNWLFLPGYKKFRIELLEYGRWKLIARLGPGAFETISGEVVKAILLTISHEPTSSAVSKDNPHQRKSYMIAGIDVSDSRTSQEKGEQLSIANVRQVNQKKQLKNPNVVISIDDLGEESLLEKYCISRTGTRTADNPQFLINYWEIFDRTTIWDYQQTSPHSVIDYSGRVFLIRWEQGNGNLKKYHQLGLASIQGQAAWNRLGVCIRLIGDLPATIYTGQIFDMNTSVVWPKALSDLPAIFSYCSSPEYAINIRKLHQRLDVTSATLVKASFDEKYWKNIAIEKYPNGLPKPYSNDPTQWIFHGHPCGSVIWEEKTKWTARGIDRIGETVLTVAVSRLLGYRWPAELDDKMELSDEARELVKQCQSLLPHSDEDGIVGIPSVSGEKNAVERLRALLADAFGDEWSSGKLGELLDKADFGGKSLEDWLRNGFFQQHCKLFHHRPFIWQIWDGLKDGFSVLVNYHKLNKSLMERLIYSYLGDWIRRQRDAVDHLEEGAEIKLSKALMLERKLKLILKGEYYEQLHEDLRGMGEFIPPVGFDIFVRWKPLHEQPIGWDPDLNDGVRLNIRPFITTRVLRWNPSNIKWKKDRGKDVESAPWYNLGLDYGGNRGDRINDHHLTLEEKHTALDEFKNRKNEL
jgi:hypothetical protein